MADGIQHFWVMQDGVSLLLVETDVTKQGHYQQLQPGETAQVRFTVREEQLRFWNPECRLVSEPGKFEISTGWADHLLLTKTFVLTED